MDDHHALITQLCDELDHNRRMLLDDRQATHPLADRARAVLARWGRSDGPAVPNGREPASVSAEPSGPIPADGEVAELVAWLRERGQERETLHLPGAALSKQLRTAPFLLTRAADLLAQRHPAPVPVSERLPGDQLCWWYEPDEDDDGSGYGGKWTLLRIRGGTATYTHWLPAHALPLPAGEVE